MPYMRLMNQSEDTYNTITRPSEVSIYKEKGSKFYGYAFPVQSEEAVEQVLDEIKSKHHKARHWCYAWRLGMEQFRYRVNDDGEPSNSAGQPIYGQIIAKDLTNILVVVVRYFGGVKLGVGGLITAYKTAAQLTLDNAKIIIKTIDKQYLLAFEYKDMDKVQRIIKKNKIDIIAQKLELTCAYTIRVRKGAAENVKKSLEELRCVKITEVQ